jgi:hypothetical protein
VDPELDPASGADFIQANRRAAVTQAVTSLDSDPEAAARSMELSQATGVPAPVINSNLEGFEQQHKASLTTQLLNNNDYLRTFINSDPMVAKVFNDSYAQLDAVSASVSKMQMGFGSRMAETAKNSFFAMFKPPEGSDLAESISPEDLKNHPIASAVYAGLGTPINMLLQGMQEDIHGVTEGVLKAGTAIGGEQFGRDIAGMIEAEVMGMTGRHGGPELPHDPLARARTYIENGREPLPTILPEYDKFRADQNKDDVDALKEATSEAQQVPRERSPTLFNSFIAQHTDAEIGIGGDAAAALYGDKLPDPDDGLLGWVPGIEDKLKLARETGTDVSVPLADWLTHAEPEIMQALHDDLRVRPGGITANEVKAASEAKEGLPEGTTVPGSEPLSEDVPSLRAATALEPLFSVGDRKLELQRMEQKAGGNFTAAQGFHDFNMVDENGRTIGSLNISEQKGGKQLYVDNITGINGLGPNDFGPALIRHLAKQIKAEFPNAFGPDGLGIAGHRVSGARERAGKEMTMPEATVKFDNPRGWDTIETRNEFSRILEGGKWETYSPATKAYIKPFAARNLEDQHLIDVVNRELDKIVPNKVAVQEADRIVAGNAKGQTGAVEPTGIYIRYKETYPIILYSMEGVDPLGTARHEAIHHLRNYGFFKPEEWATLEKAADEQGWMDKYSIADRYPSGDRGLRLEESIADAYKDWESGRFEEITPETRSVFEKMKAFFDAIREHIAKLFGKDATWEDIFQKVSTGEVGGREGTEPLDARVFNEKLSVEEQPEGGSRVFERASALGMTVDQFKRYDELMQKQHAEDIAAAQKRIDDFQRKTQTKEWKDNRRELRQEISTQIHQRPDVAADLFFSTGELYGNKIASGYKLDSDQLTDAQKAAIPKDYQARGGLNPDDVANIFGYGSGDAMLARLAEYNAAKKASGLGAKDFVARVTDMEADRQMRLRHGVLEDNIVDSVKEQVASETQLDILHEETHVLGMRIGQAPLQKANIIADLQAMYNKMSLGSVSSDAYMRAAGKAGRAAELALLKNDPQEAFRAKQQQYYATVIANEAIKTEKALGQFDKLAKRYGRPFDPKKGSVDADYSLMIRSILSQVERPYGMSVQGLEKAFGDSGYANLADFVKKQDDFYSIAGIQLPVADILLDPKFHSKFEDLTVDQFNAVSESIKGLDKFGREIEKVTVAGEKVDRRAVISDMTKQLEEKFEPQDFGATGKPGVGRTYLAALTNVETLFARFDGRDPDGLFTKTFTYPAFEAANGKDVMTREFSKEYPKDIKDPKKLVDSPLIDPLTGKQLTQFTRENVATIISNMGNDYNWRVFTKGWGIDPDVLRTWVEKNSTPEDFDRAQALGDLFTKSKGKSDVVYKNIYGIAPENIQVRPFTMHGKEYEGWYHPIIYDPLRSRLSKLQGADPAEGAHSNFWPSVSNAYTRRRTGNVDVISLSQDMVPVKLNQMLHDIAFRDFVHNTAKITRDDAFRQAITKSYGPEYVEVIDKWLERIAGNASYNSTALSMATRISGRLRSNVISTYIAFSATTVEKHGFTAAIMSAKEVGAGKFARITAEVAANSFKRAVSDLFGKSEGLGDTLWQFARKHSEELQRRDRNFEDTLGGAADLAVGQSTLRNRIIQWGSKAVAFSDMLSAVPLWLAKYDEVVNATGDHGRSVQQADRAVRRAHGSTAITNQPLIVSNSGPLAPWMTSIYGFFGTNMQRRIELAHDVNDAYKLGRQGEIAAAAKAVPQIMSSIFTYVIWPGLVEEAVTSQFTDDKRGALAHALSFTLGTAASTFIGIRDFVYGLTHGQDAQVGLMSNPLHDAGNLLKDVKKNRPLNKQNAGKLVEDAVTLFGDATGMGPKHIGAAARYGMDVWNKQQRPKTAGDVYRGVVSGTQSKRTER